MRYILSGAAAVALAASGAMAQPGNGNGNGGGGKAAASMNKGNSDANPGNRGNGDAAKQRGSDRQVQRDRGPQRSANNGNGNGNGNGNAIRADRSSGNGHAARVNRDNGNGNDFIRRGDRDVRSVTRVDYRDGRDFQRIDRSRSYIEGCPPGLAKKRNGCMPPGPAKKYYDRGLFGQSYRPSLFGLSNYRDGRYAYNDGYLLRLGSGGGISGYIPLLGGALGIGNQWPNSYDYYNVPDYYVDYYDLGSQGQYRYADNVIYRYDAEDAAITSVAALLTGDDFQVGQPMPRGYDVYNVPYTYRDRYYDTPDNMYRYSDGYVYRVDPETRLVAAAIELLI